MYVPSHANNSYGTRTDDQLYMICHRVLNTHFMLLYINSHFIFLIFVFTSPTRKTFQTYESSGNIPR